MSNYADPTDIRPDEMRARLDHILREWEETMRGDAKYEAVVRGMSAELRQALGI